MKNSVAKFNIFTVEDEGIIEIRTAKTSNSPESMTKISRSVFKRQQDRLGDLTLHVDLLNKTYAPLQYHRRLEQLYETFDPEDVLVTSSFGTNSVFLLWLISQVAPEQKVRFIDTGYHFTKTLQYKEQLEKLFNLEIVTVLPDAEAHQQTVATKLYETDTEACCKINKTDPLARVKKDFQVWISGVMAFQTENRSNLRIWEQNGDLLKFHPIIDIEEGEFLYQTGLHKLPQHPLLEHGFGSVGCIHCTMKGEGRSGRWVGQDKTECGLHL